MATGFEFLPNATRPNCRGVNLASMSSSNAPAFPHQGQRPRAHRGGREEGHHFGAAGTTVDATVVYGVNHEILQADTVSSRTRRARPTASRRWSSRCTSDRRRARSDDDDSCLHQRSGPDRRVSQGSAPRALGDHVDDPDQDRCGRRRRPGAAGTERQAWTVSHVACRPSTFRWSIWLSGQRDTSVDEDQSIMQAASEARSRAFWHTTTVRWCRSTSITTRLPRPTMRR